MPSRGGPPRARLAVISAAGALGCSLSWSGPSMRALRDRSSADHVASSMTAAFQREIGGTSQTYVSSISARGAYVVTA